MDDFGKKLKHNKETNLRKDGLSMRASNRRLRFVNVYMFYSIPTLGQCQDPRYFVEVIW